MMTPYFLYITQMLAYPTKTAKNPLTRILTLTPTTPVNSMASVTSQRPYSLMVLWLLSIL